MKAFYEWDVETLSVVSNGMYEKGDVVDHDFNDSYAQCMKLITTRKDEDDTERVITLVRDGKDGRSWATVSGGRLPTMFKDAYDRPRHPVPARYRAEVERYHKK